MCTHINLFSPIANNKQIETKTKRKGQKRNKNYLIKNSSSLNPIFGRDKATLRNNSLKKIAFKLIA